MQRSWSSLNDRGKNVVIHMWAISQLELDVLINPRLSLCVCMLTCVRTQHNSSEGITKGWTSQEKAIKADKAISSDKKRLWIMCVRRARPQE